MNLVQLRKKNDPIVRNAEKDVDDEGFSPMNPPDPYRPPGSNQAIPYAEMHPLLREYRDDHDALTVEIDAFEAMLTKIKADGVQRETETALSRFFRCLDESLFPHNRREERRLFPLLAQRLVERGECNKTSPPTTAVDLLEDEHDEFLQLAALVFNFFGMASRLRDAESRSLVLATAVQQAEVLVESLRLHIFREDQIVFSLAQKYLSAAELDAIHAMDASHARDGHASDDHDHDHGHRPGHDHGHKHDDHVEA